MSDNVGCSWARSPDGIRLDRQLAGSSETAEDDSLAPIADGSAAVGAHANVVIHQAVVLRSVIQGDAHAIATDDIRHRKAEKCTDSAL